MKKMKKSGISATVLPPEKWKTEYVSIIAAFLCSFGMMAAAKESFLCVSLPLWAIFIVSAAFCFGTMLILDAKIGKYVFPVLLIAFAAISVVPQTGIKGGFLDLINEILDFSTEKSGKIHLLFELPESASANMAFLVLMLCLSTLFIAAAKYKKILFALLIFILIFAGAATGFLSTDIMLAIFVAGAVLLILYCFSPDCRKKDGKKLLSFGIVGAALLFAVILALPLSGTYSDSVLKAAKQTVHSVLYDSKTNSMPEGNFENIGALKKSETPALEVTFDTPQKIYLKGYTGEVWDGSSWESIDKKVLSEYSDKFYWLHESGFFGQTSLSDIITLSEKKPDMETLKIKNISACKENLYLPYAFSEKKMADKLNIGDVFVKSSGNEYAFSYYTGGYKRWYNAQIAVSDGQNEKEKSEFLALEQEYRDFVYENYLDVPEGIYNSVKKHIKDCSGLPFNEIYDRIIGWLERNTVYDEAPAKWNGEGDFIRYFMDMSCRGYSVHYASAAVMMLRSCGIPARYAEGYFISEEEAENYSNGDTVIVDESHAHAWAEYYLDGAGWLPFEATPGYIDGEFDDALFSASDDVKSRRHSLNNEPNVKEQPDEDKLGENKNGFEISAILFVVLGIVFVLALIIYVIFVRIRLKKALERIDKADNKDGIALRFGYAEMLRAKADFSDEELSETGFEEAVFLNREALFSPREMEDREREKVDAFSQKILSKCKEKWGFPKRFFYRWIKGIYL